MSTSGKNLSSYNPEEIPDGTAFRIAILVSEWNPEITSNLLKGSQETLIKHGVQANNILIKYTPGSYELAFAAKQIALTTKPHAIIALGSVIRGETPHFDFICNALANGIMNVGLETNIPVILGVLTDNNLQQAIDRSGGKYGNKGVECAIAALKMIALKNSLKD